MAGTAGFTQNTDDTARYIAYTQPNADTIRIHPVVGWGSEGEGWPGRTPIITGMDGPPRRGCYGRNCWPHAVFQQTRVRPG